MERVEVGPGGRHPPQGPAYAQPLWRPPPTACLTASGAASEVPSLLMHPVRVGGLRRIRRGAGGRGGLDPKVCVTEMARSNFADCKFRVFPRRSLWLNHGR